MIGLLLLACSGGEIQKPDQETGWALGPLTVDAVAPAQGSAAGGTALEISGEGFTGGSTEVSIDGAACAELVVPSATLLTCTTPPGAPGEVSLRVSRLDDGAVATASFTYLDDGGGTDSGGTDSGETGGGTGDSGITGDTGPGEAVDYCHLQWPCSQEVAPDTESEAVYCWIYRAGVTDAAGQGGGLTVELGYGADGSDPAEGWTWTASGYLEDVVIDAAIPNDLYEGRFTTPRLVGDYDYACRASADGGVSWLYCDAGDDGAGDGCGDGLLGSSDGYSPEQSGQLTVR